MKKIIDGKRYDTEKAEEIAAWWNGYAKNDFKRCEEVLFKTARGNYFLHGEGGAMSAYSKPCGDMTGGGEDIIPMTREEAIRWCENRDCTAALEEEFADALIDA